MLRALAVYTKEPVIKIHIVNGKKEEFTVEEERLVKFAGQNVHDEIVSAIRGTYETNTVGFIYVQNNVLIDPQTKIQKPCWFVIVSKTPHLSDDLKLQLAYLFANMRHVINRQALVGATLEDMYLNTPNFIHKDILVAKTKDEIEETRAVMIANIEAVLKRGEAIENLKQRTEALESQAMLFRKEAKKLNYCCGGYVPNPWG